MTESAVLKAVLRNGLAHVVPNACAVAQGSEEAEHIHQLRVGLRRLRTAIRDLAFLVPDTGWHYREGALAQTFQSLGELRDQQSVFEPLKRQLIEAGITDVSWADLSTAPRHPAEIVGQPSFLAVLADLLHFSLSADLRPRAHPHDLKHRLGMQLAKLHAQVVKDGCRFHELAMPEQHRVRKRLKRLRYLCEFVASLYRVRSTERYLASLRPALDALGTHNDLAVAWAAAQAAAERGHVGAALALAWLVHARKASAQKSEQALTPVAAAVTFWTNP